MASSTSITNIPGIRAYGAFRSISGMLNKTMEHLATGRRVNRASDDPSAVGPISQLKTRMTEINKRIERLDFEDTYYGAREGAQAALADLLQELNSNTVQSANTGALTDAERDGIQIETDSVIKAIDFLSQTYRFNGEQILSGFDSLHLGNGVATRPGTIDSNGQTTPGASYSLHDLMSGGDLNLATGNREKAQQVVSSALNSINTSRAAIGTKLQANDSERHLLRVELEGTETFRSQLEDADYAQETANLIREQVLQQASLYVLQVSAKQKSDLILSLLK